MEGGLQDKIQELGYGCMATREDCRETLLSFGLSNLNPAVIARVLGGILHFSYLNIEL